MAFEAQRKKGEAEKKRLEREKARQAELAKWLKEEAQRKRAEAEARAKRAAERYAEEVRKRKERQAAAALRLAKIKARGCLDRSKRLVRGRMGTHGHIANTGSIDLHVYGMNINGRYDKTSPPTLVIKPGTAKKLIGL